MKLLLFSCFSLVFLDYYNIIHFVDNILLHNNIIIVIRVHIYTYHILVYVHMYINFTFLRILAVLYLHMYNCTYLYEIFYLYMNEVTIWSASIFIHTFISIYFVCPVWWNLHIVHPIKNIVCICWVSKKFDAFFGGHFFLFYNILFYILILSPISKDI